MREGQGEAYACRQATPTDIKTVIYFRDYRPNASPLQGCTIDAIGQNITTIDCQLSIGGLLVGSGGFI
ncbi:MAG: hypothetical protein MUE44_00740 [Oscillatoriaceae cyanobacterium Prado104]|nr:hypothetical protein [Oscillatoriaceae cyanobacterium Prado104]